jgi:hypothetical protein
MADQPQPPHPFVVVRGETSPDHTLDGAVLAIGNFDGVHRGHRAVIAAALARAKALGRPAAALTFEPHPRGFFRPNEPLFRLTDERSKLRLLATTGLDGAIVLRFDAALAGLSAADFVTRILVGRFAVAGVAIGFDFHFGLNRTGSPEYLAAQGAKLGFAVDIVPRFEDQGRAGSLRPGPRGACRRSNPRGERASRLSLVRQRRGGPWRQARAGAWLPYRQSAARPWLWTEARLSMRCAWGSARGATMASPTSDGDRCSTRARCCSKSSCSILPAIFMARLWTSPSSTGSGLSSIRQH